MARYEFVKGLPVITMAEGKQVGKIDDLVIDPERKAVGWLRLHSGGMIGGERLWVSTAAVHGVGEHAVTINSEADAVTSANAAEALALVKTRRTVIGSKVLTEGGERIGEVRDFEFDPETFVLTALSVPPTTNTVGEILTIAGDKVVTIGEDMIVVASGSVTRLAPMSVAE
jgi:sporulation protein YlmC with PRC-barrel domain